MKLRKGDEVKIVRGKEKGKKGKIEKILPVLNKVIVIGLNTYKRHVKRNAMQSAEIKTIVKPLPVSNVILICPKCSKTTRVGYQINSEKKERICKKCEQSI